MKKCGLVLAFSFTLVLVIYAQATASIRISGTVPQKMAIRTTITETTFLDALNRNSQPLGSIFVDTNASLSYTLTITSTNGSVLRLKNGSEADTFGYTLDIGDSKGIDLSEGYQMVFTPDFAKTRYEIPLNINFRGAGQQETFPTLGEYEDILVITISTT